MTMKLLFFLTMVFISSSSRSDEILVDRLILEIGVNSFTQRQLELYMTLKRTLQDQDPKEVVFINKENWTKSIFEYRDDMILIQEANRLGHGRPSKKILDDAVKYILKVRSVSVSFDTFIKKMGASSQEIKRVLASIFQVRIFSLSKNKAKNKHENKIKQLEKHKVWLKDIKSKYAFRFYEGAQYYKSIRPYIGISK